MKNKEPKATSNSEHCLSIDSKIDYLRSNRGKLKYNGGLETLAQSINEEGEVGKNQQTRKNCADPSKCNILDLSGNVHKKLSPNIDQKVFYVQNNPNLLLNMLRNQTNQVKSYLSVFLVKGEFILNFIQHLTTQYQQEIDSILSNYIQLKMRILETLQIQNSKPDPETPKRERAGKGLGDLTDFGLTLENYQSTDQPLKKNRANSIKIEEYHVKYEGFSTTAEYIQEFLENLKEKVDNRIFNIEKMNDLLPKLGKKYDQFNQVFSVLKNLGKELTTEFSTKFRKIWDGTLVEIGLDVKSLTENEDAQYESLDQAYHKSMVVLEYKICYLIQNWLLEFQKVVTNPLEMFIIYTNHSVKVEDETSLCEDICHINDIIREVYVGDEDYLIKGDFFDYLDREIDSKGRCKFDIFSLLDEDYQKYFSLKYPETDDTQILNNVQSFGLNYRTQSLFISGSLTKIEYSPPGQKTVFKCILILDILGNLILLNHEYNLNEHTYQFDELIFFFFPVRKVSLNCTQKSKITNFKMNFTKFQNSAQGGSLSFTCSEEASQVAAFIKTFSIIKKEIINLHSSESYHQIEDSTDSS